MSKSGLFSSETVQRCLLVMFLSLSAVSSGEAWAQAEGGGGGGAGTPAQDAPFEFGLHTGNLLPNQINGVTEIMGLGGIRSAFRMAPRSYVEGGFITGNGEGQQWRNIHVDVRIDTPIENLLASAYLGADAIYYKGQGRSEVLNFGGHAGGAVQVGLTPTMWFRTDMKFGFSPGTSLYFSLGFVWRLGSGGSAGS